VPILGFLHAASSYSWINPVGHENSITPSKYSLMSPSIRIVLALGLAALDGVAGLDLPAPSALSEQRRIDCVPRWERAGLARTTLGDAHRTSVDNVTGLSIEEALDAGEGSVDPRPHEESLAGAPSSSSGPTSF